MRKLSAGLILFLFAACVSGAELRISELPTTNATSPQSLLMVSALTGGGGYTSRAMTISNLVKTALSNLAVSIVIPELKTTNLHIYPSGGGHPAAEAFASTAPQWLYTVVRQGGVGGGADDVALLGVDSSGAGALELRNVSEVPYAYLAYNTTNYLLPPLVVGASTIAAGTQFKVEGNTLLNGTVTLAGDGTAALHAVTKQQMEAAILAGTNGLSLVDYKKNISSTPFTNTGPVTLTGGLTNTGASLFQKPTNRVAGFYSTVMDAVGEESLIHIGGVNLETHYGVEIGATPEVSSPAVQDHAFIVKTSPTTGLSHLERLRVTSDGNVGIGTNSPLRTLSIRGTGFRQIQSVGTLDSQAGGAEFYNSIGDYAIIESFGPTFSTASLTNQAMIYSSRDLLLGAGGRQEWARMSLAGNFGIATNSPQARLHVNGHSIIASNQTVGGNLTVSGGLTNTGNTLLGASGTAVFLGQVIPTNAFGAVRIGVNAGTISDNTNGVAIGTSAGFFTTNSGDSVAIGYLAMQQANLSVAAVGVGRQAGYLSTNMQYTVMNGSQSGLASADSYHSVFDGAFAGLRGTNNYSAVMLGYNAGGSSSNAHHSVFIGRMVGTNTARPYTLMIDSDPPGNTNTLIYGEFDNNMLRVNGSLQVTNTIRSIGGISAWESDNGNVAANLVAGASSGNLILYNGGTPRITLTGSSGSAAIDGQLTVGENADASLEVVPLQQLIATNDAILASVGTAGSFTNASILYVQTNGFALGTAIRGNPNKPYNTITAAVAQAQSGDTIRVGAGKHYVINAAVELPPNVSLVGEGMKATEIIGNAQLIVDGLGPIVNPGDNSYIGHLSILATNEATFSGCIGVTVASPRTFTNVVVDSVFMFGNTDNIYVDTNALAEMTVMNSYLFATYDNVFLDGGASAASPFTNSLIHLQNCKIYGTNLVNLNNNGDHVRNINVYNGRVVLDNCSLYAQGGTFWSANIYTADADARVWVNNTSFSGSTSGGFYSITNAAGNVMIQSCSIPTNQIKGVAVTWNDGTYNQGVTNALRADLLGQWKPLGASGLTNIDLSYPRKYHTLTTNETISLTSSTSSYWGIQIMLYSDNAGPDRLVTWNTNAWKANSGGGSPITVPSNSWTLLVLYAVTNKVHIDWTGTNAGGGTVSGDYVTKIHADGFTNTGTVVFTGGLIPTNAFGVIVAGYDASLGDNTNGVSIGFEAGKGATNSWSTSFIGYQAGNSSTGAFHVVASGIQAAERSHGSHASVFNGYQAGMRATNSFNTIFQGYTAGKLSTNASYSVFNGYEAGLSSLNAGQSVMIGYRTGRLSTNSLNSVLIGYEVGNLSSNNSYAVQIGHQAGSVSEATGSVFLGYRAGYLSGGANRSVFIGNQAGTNVVRANTLLIDGGVFPSGDGALVYGEFDNRLLRIHGSLQVTNGLRILNASRAANLTADNQSVSTTNKVLLSVSSDDGTAGNRTFVISSGQDAGQTVTIEWVGTNAGELIDDASATGGGNIRLSGTWTPTQYDTLSLVWNGTDWIERGRSAN